MKANINNRADNIESANNSIFCWRVKNPVYGPGGIVLAREIGLWGYAGRQAWRQRCRENRAFGSKLIPSATIVSRTALSRVFVARKREELAVALGHIKYRKKMDFATSKTTKASMCSATFTAATAAAF